MPQTIARIYRSQETARTVEKELHERGFRPDDVHVITRSEPQAPPTVAPEGATAPADDPILASVIETGVSQEHARVYTEAIHQGQTLVTVYPPFGTAATATQILDSHDPATVTLPEVTAPQAPAWDNAAPLSSALGWRTLSSDPAPLSNYFKWKTIKPEPAASKTLERIRQQSRDAAPLSGRIGMPVLSDNPAPLSSKFGWRTLLDRAAPLSQRFGWRVLLDNPSPLSDRIGWRVLVDDPTPLSSALNLPVLTKR